MSRPLVWLIAGLSLCAACKEEAPSEPAPLPVASASDPAAELAAHLAEIAACKTDDKGQLDMTCRQAIVLHDWTLHNDPWLRANAPAVTEVARPFLEAQAAATRSLVIRLLGLGVKVKHGPARKDLVAMAGRERDLGLMLQIVKAATQDPKDAELRSILVTALGSEAEPVRRAAVSAIVNKSTPPVGKERELLLAMLKGDPSRTVREVLCFKLGVGEEEEILSAFDQVLDDPATHPELYDSCLAGLMMSWSHKSVERRSKAAYERTMKRLEAGPRDDKHPLASAIGELSLSEADKAPFFDKERALKALRGILADKTAFEDSRAAAAGALMMMLAPTERDELGVPFEEASALIEKRAAKLKAAGEKR